MSKLSSNMEHAYFLAPEKLRFLQSKPPHTCGIRHVKENVLCQPGYIYIWHDDGLVPLLRLVDSRLHFKGEEGGSLLPPHLSLYKHEKKIKKKKPKSKLKSMLSPHRINSKRAKKIICGGFSAYGLLLMNN